jgi:hypothetical protein
MGDLGRSVASTAGQFKAAKSRKENELLIAQQKKAEEEARIAKDEFDSDFKLGQLETKELIEVYQQDPSKTSEEIAAYAQDAWKARKADFEKRLTGADQEVARDYSNRYDEDVAGYMRGLNPRLAGKKVQEFNAKVEHTMGRLVQAGDIDGAKAEAAKLRLPPEEIEAKIQEVATKGLYKELEGAIEDLAYNNDKESLEDVLGQLESGEGRIGLLDTRGALALKAKRSIRRIEDGQQKTYKGFVKEVTKYGELDEESLIEDERMGRISEQQAQMIREMVPDAKAAVERKEVYELDKRSQIYGEYKKNVYKGYFEDRAKGRNVAMDEDKQTEYLEQIKSLPLGDWAKADLYSVHLEVLSMAVQEDDGWFSGEVANLMDDGQRDFWSRYLNRASNIVAGKKIEADFSEIIQDDVSSMEDMITKEEFPKTPEEQRALMDKMLLPYVKGVVRGQLQNTEIPTVNSQEEYDALPSGSAYLDSNGNRGVKR